jgi:hypothetical protein
MPSKTILLLPSQEMMMMMKMKMTKKKKKVKMIGPLGMHLKKQETAQV